MKNEIKHSIVGIIIGIIVGVVLIKPIRPFSIMMQPRGEFNNFSGNQFNKIRGTRLDQHFIEQMIPHHEGAIVMANLALKKATQPEIKALAEAIIIAQQKEIEEMKSWYESWFDKDVSFFNTSTLGGGMMSSGGMHMGGQEEITKLEKAVNFDKVFIEAMIPHHQLAIMMARMLKTGTNRPEMLNLAENIIVSQSAEIKKMQEWYELWY